MNTVIKLVEAEELPAICPVCDRFLDDLCLSFPAVYDLSSKAYLCDVCAQVKAPNIAAMHRLIMAGAYYAHLLITESQDADLQGEYLKTCALVVHDKHFANVFGQPEPEYLSSAAIQ
jgi:hypothetical protein